MTTAGIALATAFAAAPLAAEPIRYTCDGTRIVIDTAANRYQIDGGAFTPMSWTFDGAWLRVLPRDGRKRLGFAILNGDLLMGAESYPGACRADNLEAVLRLEAGPGSSLRNAFIALPEPERRQIQAALRSRSLYSGDLDGLWGTGTLQAMLALMGDRADLDDPAQAVSLIAELRAAGACLQADPDATCGAPPIAAAPPASPAAALAAEAPAAAPAPVIVIVGQADAGAAAYAVREGTAAEPGQVVYLAAPNPAPPAPAAVPNPAPAAGAEIQVAALGDASRQAMPDPGAPAPAPAAAAASPTFPAPAQATTLDLAMLKRNLSDDRTRVQRDAYWSEVEGMEVTFVGTVEDVRPESLLEYEHVQLALDDGSVVGCAPRKTLSLDLTSVNIGERYVCTGKLAEYVKLFGEISFMIEAADLRRL